MKLLTLLLASLSLVLAAPLFTFDVKKTQLQQTTSKYRTQTVNQPTASVYMYTI